MADIQRYYLRRRFPPALDKTEKRFSLECDEQVMRKKENVIRNLVLVIRNWGLGMAKTQQLVRKLDIWAGLNRKRAQPRRWDRRESVDIIAHFWQIACPAMSASQVKCFYASASFWTQA
jgi:hypothetical protein